MDEDQNTKDIRYVDEKLDKLKSELNKAINKQGQASAKLEGQLSMLKAQSKSDATKLDEKITTLQRDMNDWKDGFTDTITEMTNAITRVSISTESTQKAVQELVDVRKTLDRHDIQLAHLEKTKQDNIDIRKEKIKANGAIVVALISGVVALISAIIGVLLH